MSTSAALPEADAPTRGADLPDRTPRTTALQSRRRVQQVCVVCSAAYLVAPAAARFYQTCSHECSSALRRRVHSRGQGAGGRGQGPRQKRPVARRGRSAPVLGLPPLEQRSDLRVLPRGGLEVFCVRCGGVRGRWRCSEVPPPELCWRCLMRRNAGLEPGIPLG